MAVVSTEKIYVGNQKFTKKIRVNADGVFRIKLPSWVSEVIGDKEVEGKTLRDAGLAFNAAVRQFRDAGTTTKKVILYNLEISAVIKTSPDDEDVEWAGVDRSDVSMFRGSGICFGLSAAVAIEETIKLGNTARYNYKAVADSLIPQSLCMNVGMRRGRHEEQMDWTQEREEFFAGVGQAMANMVVKLDAFFKDGGDLVKAIDSGQPLLGVSPSKPKPNKKKKVER